MSFDFSTLVTDRTQADVNRVKQIAEKIKNGTASESELAEFNSAAMKGAYNYTDLNRVTAAMEALKSKLEGYGYTAPGYQRIKVPHPVTGGGSKLPEGYTELAYIESTGTQYVDTRFKANNNTRVVAEAQFVSTSSPQVLFGGRTSAGSKNYTLMLTDGVVRSDYNGTYTQTWSVGLTTIRTFDKNKETTTIDGTSKSYINATFQCDYNLLLFALNNAGTVQWHSSVRLYSCQIYDNGTLVRDYVPCINQSGDVGLFDVVNQQFYGNAGTGVFEAGERVVAPATVSATVASNNLTEYDPYIWYEFDWPTPETMTVYLLNVVALRSVFAVMKSTASVPSDMVGLMLEEANNIEKILVDINELLMKSTQVWFYSGELFAGEV